MSEALKFEGRLALLKKEAAELAVRITGDVQAVRNLLDPFAEPAELDAEAAAAQAVELAEKAARLRSVQERIRIIERELGR